MSQDSVRFIRVHGRIVPIHSNVSNNGRTRTQKIGKPITVENGSDLDKAHKYVNKSASVGAKIGAAVTGVAVGALFKSEFSKTLPYFKAAARTITAPRLSLVGGVSPSLARVAMSRAGQAGKLLKPVAGALPALGATAIWAGIGALYGHSIGKGAGSIKAANQIKEKYGEIPTLETIKRAAKAPRRK